MSSNNDVPPATWRWLGCAAVILLVAAIGGISLISAGAFDPDINGTLRNTFELASKDVPAHSSALQRLDVATPKSDYSLRLRARHSDGETNVGYGLAIGNDDGFVLVALSPLGYLTVLDVSDANELESVTVSRQPSDERNLPWQTWPHIRSGQQSNEIWIDVNEGAITGIRINRELLQTQDFAVDGDQIAIWTESFGEAATIEFQELELFY
jgi:hypothetical protein